MKKIIPILLCLLLLTGCGLTEQLSIVKTEYFEPSVEAAREGVALSSERSESGPNVLTDRAKLEPYAPAESLYTRASPGRITELVVSDSHGRLLPYVGAYIYDDAGEIAGESYGLVTQGGKIVLDPVLDELYQASYTDVNGGVRWLSIYIMGLINEDGAMSYALCGADGGWVTDFEYAVVIPMELGVLCMADDTGRAAVCIKEDGETLFNTQYMEAATRLMPGSMADLAVCSEGFMCVTYNNGQRGFLDAKGELLNRYVEMPSYYDEIGPFSYGLAAVKLGGRWGYLKTDGSFLLPMEYDSASTFMSGLGVVSRDGLISVVGPDGEVKKEFPEAAGLSVERGYVVLTDAQGGVQYLRADTLEPMTMYEYQGIPFENGYWVRGANGVRAIVYDLGEVYFSGGAELTDCAGGLYLLTLADGTSAVMDKDSRVLVAGGELSFAGDSITGETYILRRDAQGRVDAYTASGVLAAENAVGNPIDGYIMSRDKNTSGWKDSGNQWIFRLNLDAGD